MNLLLLLVVIGAGVVIFLTLRGKKDDTPKIEQGPRRELSPGTPHPMDIRPGDIVSLDGEDWLVKKDATYWDDDGEEVAWREFTLESGTKMAWLSAGDDDEIELSFVTKVRDLRFTDEPPRRLDYQGVDYELDEKGWAVYAEGYDLEGDGERMQYFDYVGRGGKVLSVAQWDEHEFEVSAGREVSPHELGIMAGS